MEKERLEEILADACIMKKRSRKGYDASKSVREKLFPKAYL